MQTNSPSCQLLSLRAAWLDGIASEIQVEKYGQLLGGFVGGHLDDRRQVLDLVVVRDHFVDALERLEKR